MAEREPVTQNMTVSDVQRDLRPLVKKVSKQETRVLVEEDGQPVAALVSPDDLERLKRLDVREDAWRVVDQIRARNRDKDPEEVERDIAEEIRKIRAEDRARRERAEPA